jgi:hypothetical protein
MSAWRRCQPHRFSIDVLFSGTIVIDEDLMRIKQLTLSIVMLAVISPNLSFGRSLGQSGGKLVKVEKVWGGEIKLELRQQAPPNGLFVDEKAWAKLWMAYRGNEELPKIDFDKQMILVRVGDDPNDIGFDPNSLILDEEGDLKVSFIQTEVRYINHKTCKYIFLLTSREGVKSINGSLFTRFALTSPASHHLQTSGYIGFAVALIFGLWWLASPRSVIAFYTRFHRGAVRMPAAGGIRIAGALWVALVVIVAIIFSRTWS